LILLVGVRIEILGKIFVGLIGLPRGWLNEGADIGENGEILLAVKVALHLGHVGVQAVVGGAVDLKRKKLCLWERENGAGLLIAGVARINGHEHVVAVVSTEHEDAHQGLIVRRGLSEGADQSKFGEAGEERGAGGGAAG